MNCSKCGVEYDDSYRFCPNCGTSAAKMTEEGEETKQIECLNCKTTLDSSFGFCPNCGAAVKNKEKENNKTKTTKMSETINPELSNIIFILLAANVFTALSFVFHIVIYGGYKEALGYNQSTKYSLCKLFDEWIESIKDYSNNSKSAFSEYFWEIATMVVVGIAVVVCVVNVAKALKEFFSGKDKTNDLLETLKKMYYSSIAAVVELSAFFIYADFISEPRSKSRANFEYSFTIWFWLLAGVAVICLFVERSILKANGCLSDANTPVANNTKK